MTAGYRCRPWRYPGARRVSFFFSGRWTAPEIGVPMAGMASIILKPNRDKSVRHRHPWIFSGAIQKVTGDPGLGQTVVVRSSGGEALAVGAYSPASQIRVRLWSCEANTPVDGAFFHQRLETAIALRSTLISSANLGACRLVHAESDGLPGVVVDRYGDFLVCQFLTAGAEIWRDTIVAQLAAICPVRGIYERSNQPIRAKEGLVMRDGSVAGQSPPEWIPFQENGLLFQADVRQGHKTGFYLDQRDNRAIVAGMCADLEVLNCFAYTGGFAVAALMAGARHVTNLDISDTVLAAADTHARLNAIADDRMVNMAGDVFQVLRRFRDMGRRFDAIILDPPKFADSRSRVPQAARGYKDINLLAMKLLRPGGWLFTFSCSGHMTPDLFQKIVADAAVDAGRDAQIVRTMTQGPDHPVALAFPEGHYLKGFACRVL